MSNWSNVVTQTSRSLKLEKDVFTFDCPIKIAQSLKRSAINKPNPLLSSMSMLNFYINRAGKRLPIEKLKILNDAKEWLRVIFVDDN